MLCTQFKASLGYMRSFLKKNKTKKEEEEKKEEEQEKEEQEEEGEEEEKDIAKTETKIIIYIYSCAQVVLCHCF